MNAAFPGGINLPQHAQMAEMQAQQRKAEIVSFIQGTTRMIYCGAVKSLVSEAEECWEKDVEILPMLAHRSHKAAMVLAHHLGMLHKSTEGNNGD